MFLSSNGTVLQYSLLDNSITQFETNCVPLDYIYNNETNQLLIHHVPTSLPSHFSADPDSLQHTLSAYDLDGHVLWTNEISENGQIIPFREQWLYFNSNEISVMNEDWEAQHSFTLSLPGENNLLSMADGEKIYFYSFYNNCWHTLAINWSGDILLEEKNLALYQQTPLREDEQGVTILAHSGESAYGSDYSTYVRSPSQVMHKGKDVDLPRLSNGLVYALSTAFEADGMYYVCATIKDQNRSVAGNAVIQLDQNLDVADSFFVHLPESCGAKCYHPLG